MHWTHIVGGLKNGREKLPSVQDTSNKQISNSKFKLPKSFGI